MNVSQYKMMRCKRFMLRWDSNAFSTVSENVFCVFPNQAAENRLAQINRY